MPKLLFIQPEFGHQSCELFEGVTRVGRGSDNSLVIGDNSVSAHHCEIVVNWNEVLVRERGSRNGTWVAGVRVETQRPVNHGETIRFGRVEARLELPEPPLDDSSEDTEHFERRFLHWAAEPEASRPRSYRIFKAKGNGASREPDTEPNEATHLLATIDSGDPQTAAQWVEGANTGGPPVAAQKQAHEAAPPTLPPTAKRWWTYARAWLLRELSKIDR